MTRVLLLDGHELLRRGMRDALREAGLSVVGEAGCWSELEPLLRSAAADVLVLDINVPGLSGQDALETLKTQPSPPHALVLLADAQGACAERALRAGARGYLNKSCDIAALIDAIGTVAQGRRYIAPAIASRLADALAPAAQPPLHQRFSNREQQLLMLLASGRRLPDIAERLELPPKAVGVYRARLLEKMKLSTNAELAHYAIHHKLVAAPGLSG